MDGFLTEKSSEENKLPSEIFKEQFPGYLAIGMTYDEYWNGDPELPKYYRKADEIRQKRINAEAWLYGRYVYEALCSMVPLPVGFAKKNGKPKPYPNEPHKYETDEEKRERDGMEAGREHMKRAMEAWNAKFRAKEGGNKTDG